MDEDVAYAHDLAAQEREDQLRQLLSYAETASLSAAQESCLHSNLEAKAAHEREAGAYTDMATKLAAILDGES